MLLNVKDVERVYQKKKYRRRNLKHVPSTKFFFDLCFSLKRIYLQKPKQLYFSSSLLLQKNFVILLKTQILMLKRLWCLNRRVKFKKRFVQQSVKFNFHLTSIASRTQKAIAFKIVPEKRIRNKKNIIKVQSTKIINLL